MLGDLSIFDEAADTIDGYIHKDKQVGCIVKLWRPTNFGAV